MIWQSWTFRKTFLIYQSAYHTFLSWFKISESRYIGLFIAIWFIKKTFLNWLCHLFSIFLSTNFTCGKEWGYSTLLISGLLASISILLEKHLWNLFTCKASLLQLTDSYYAFFTKIAVSQTCNFFKSIFRLKKVWV